MTKPPLTEPVSLRLPPDLTARLDRAAQDFLLTRSSIIRMVLAGWVENLDHPSARAALKTVSNTEESTSQ
jgi:predicted transcriptional regulator